MGAYLNFFIEYKNRKTGNWTLAEAYKMPEQYNSVYFGHENETLYPDENPLETINTVPMVTICKHSTQNGLREIISDANFCGTGRGFPQDMSVKLKTLCDATDTAILRESEMLTAERNANIKNGDSLWGSLFHDQKDLDDFMAKPVECDERGRKTWCTLAEIENFVEKKIDDDRQRVTSYEHLRENNGIKELLLDIRNILINGKDAVQDPKHDSTDESEFYEESIEEYKDEIAEYEWILSYCEGIRFFTEAVSGEYYIESSDIRIIAYII